jgi:hypothetical protein
MKAMQWVCYVEVQGLYAAVARKAGLVPADRAVVVLRAGRVFDGCREAFSGGLVLGAPARQALRDAPHAAQVDFAAIDCAGAARTWWDRCLAHTPYLEPGEPHQLFLSLPTPGDELTPAVKAEVAELLAEAARHGFVAFAGIGTSKLVARAAAMSCKEGWLLRRPGRRPGRDTPDHGVCRPRRGGALSGVPSRSLPPRTTGCPAPAGETGHAHHW